MICTVCHGSGSLPNWPASKPEFWTCPCCGGSGARIVYGPAEIGPGTRKRRRALAAEMEARNG